MVSDVDIKDDQLLDLGTVAQLREVMEDEFDDLIETYFMNVPVEMKNIRESFEHQDAAQMAKHAHTLKGSSSNLGAQPLADLFYRLECMGKAGRTDDDVERLINQIERTYSRVRQLLAAEL